MAYKNTPTRLEQTSGTSPTIVLTPKPVTKLLYSKKDAAYLLSISVRKLEYLIAKGVIKVKRIGTRVLISHLSLQKFARS